MIYVHKFTLANGHGKKEMIKVYDNVNTAMEQQSILGGEITDYVDRDTHFEVMYKASCMIYDAFKEVVDEVECEVANIIDDLSTEAPGSARMLDPDSEEWRTYKATALQAIREIILNRKKS